MYEEKNRWRFWLVRAGYVNGTLSFEKILNEKKLGRIINLTILCFTDYEQNYKIFA